MKKIVIVLLLSILPLLTPLAHGQSKLPGNLFGLGLYADPAGAALGAPGGVSLTYAITHQMQVGTYFSLDIASGGGNSTTGLALEPYFRYLFSGAVNPFVQGGFAVITGGGNTNAGLFFGGGLAYGVSQNFMMHFDLNVLSVVFTNGGGVDFGFSSVKVGGDWFL